MSKTKNILVILDAHALIHRSYHALPALTSSEGEPIGAVYGVSAVLLKLVRELKPTHMAAAFDMPSPTFRHIAYEEYKARRPKAPDELIEQFKKTKEVIKALKIPTFEAERFEADDLIGTLVEKFRGRKDLKIIIASGDLDTLQLVQDDAVTVYTLKKGIQDTITYDEKRVRERFGFGPEYLPDFKGLKGDPSDNIKGVRGIGEKTGIQLIQEYKTLDNLFRALKSRTTLPAWLNEKLKQKLLENEEEAYFSRELGLIRRDAPLSPKLRDLEWKLDKKNAGAVFQKFHFTSLIKRLETMNGGAKEAPLPKDTTAPAAKEIKTAKDKNALLKALEKAEKISLFSSKNGEQSIFLLINETSWELKGDMIAEFSNPLLKSSHNAKVYAHNAKDILKALATKEIPPLRLSLDVMIASWVLNPDLRDYSLENLCQEYPPSPQKLLSAIPKLASRLAQTLKKEGLWDAYITLEMPIIAILASMERTGILASASHFKNLSREFKKELAKIEKEIYDLAGFPFNIQSPKILREVLFEKLKIAADNIARTPTKELSTASPQLFKIQEAHPIIKKIMRFRELAKLISTYTEVLPRLIDPNDGRIHTTFHQTGTATGRLSSSNPNLQNIPVRTKEGVEIRRAFVAPFGSLFVSFDYSQLELRIAASLSQDKKMMAAFQRGLDIHQITAAEINNVSPEKVTPEMRRQAKIVNFGILYGMGESALAETANMPREKARLYLKEYFDDFKGIAAYIEKIKDVARRKGFVETLYGRRRYVPGIKSGNFRVARESERIAVNAPIQGTEADILKRSMIEIAKEFGLHSPSVRLLLQVHDELLFEIETNALKQAVKKIKTIMQTSSKLDVPLLVDVKTGKSWGDLEKYDAA